jgi:hypothetical protein
MMCIYAVDASGYMTGCRSGEHLQHCGNEYDNYYLNYKLSLCDLPCKVFMFTATYFVWLVFQKLYQLLLTTW